MGNCQSEGSSRPTHAGHPQQRLKQQKPTLAASPVNTARKEAKREFDNNPGYAIDIAILGRCEEWRKVTSVYTTLLKNKLNHDPRIDELKKEGKLSNDLDPHTVLEHCHEGTKKESLMCHRHIDALSKAITPDMIAEGLWNSLRQRVGNGLLIDLMEVTAAEQQKPLEGVLLHLPSPRSDFGSVRGSINYEASVRSTAALSEAGDNEDTHDAENEMFAAATRGDDEVITRLHDNGISVMIKNNWCTTPLHCAATAGHLSTVELLLDLGADIECVAVGSTPLHLAAVNGKTAVCESLVALGANINAISSDGFTPLHKAAMFGNCDTIAFLIEAGADVNAASKDGTTPLHVAAKCGNVMAVELIHTHGGDVNGITKTGVTPFHLAAKKGSNDTIRYLHKQGVNIHQTDDHRSTALHYAARSGHSETCALLLRIGLSPNEADKAGHTALRYAVKDGDQRVIAAIQGLKADSGLHRSQSISFSKAPSAQNLGARRPSQANMRRAASVSCQYSGDALSTDALAKTYSRNRSGAQHRNSMGGFGRRTSSRGNPRRGSLERRPSLDRRGSADRRGSIDSISNISRDGSTVGFTNFGRRRSFVDH